jgi:hypothetical protein
MFPDTYNSAVYENYGGYPSLRPIDAQPVLHNHKVILILMSEEESIEIRQEADQRLFKPGLCQLIEVLPKDLRHPALNIRISFSARRAEPLTNIARCSEGTRNSVRRMHAALTKVR